MKPSPRPPAAQRVTAFFRRLVAENLALKALSLFVALAIWAWLQREQVITVQARAAIEYDWPADLVVANDVVVSAMVSVRGPQGVVRGLSDQRLSLRVDLSDLQEGAHTIDFTDKPVRGLPGGVQVARVSPAGAQVEFDEALTRQVKVRPALIGDVADGYKRLKVTAEPAVVAITGPKSQVRNIAEVSTNIVDVSGWSETQQTRVPLAIERRSIRPVNTDPISVTVEIEPLLTERTFTEVQVVERAAGWSAAPSSARIVVQGPAPALKSIDSGALSILLHLPTPTPVGEELALEWQPEDAFTDEDGGVQVVLPGGLSDVTVTEVSPATFTLQPTEPPE